ncbi:DUF4810 domain-containing protein [Chlorobium sp. KB01]|uniref:DUF4810 domain-containing protein n=1 Tax=Chlorobium sp. KB01 TaxID=1917528 RepID=UPI00097636AC|nr:DUF4810 domain-containing protein [Chlorobium sp. KB01]
MKKSASLFMILLLQGCASQTPVLYEWGNYEDLVYKSYSGAGKLSPDEHIQKLEADYQVSRSSNRPVPPGYYAQLGLLYYQTGRPDDAAKSFTTEAELFPESKVFMNRLIEKLKQKGK